MDNNSFGVMSQSLQPRYRFRLYQPLRAFVRREIEPNNERSGRNYSGRRVWLPNRKPAFLITIDTEGDNLWSNPREVTTRNAAFLPRFQTLCERHDLRPTYLTDYQMATAPQFVEFAQDALRRGTIEVGMHLHAWDSPPLSELTHDDWSTHPYLIEFTDEMMREKIRVMTDTLETTFGVKMLSHRAGRWSFDQRYMSMLVEQGYAVDCSVTPRVSWARSLGDPAGAGGTDYTAFPDEAYWLSTEDISRPGAKPGLLEVPVTILSRETVLSRRTLAAIDSAPPLLAIPLRPVGRLIRRFAPPAVWLRPRGNNTKAMMWLVRRVIEEGRDYAEFMLHSSELMPGGSPTFQSERCIERLYEQLEILFSWVSTRFEATTLYSYRCRFEELSPIFGDGLKDQAAAVWD